MRDDTPTSERHSTSNHSRTTLHVFHPALNAPTPHSSLHIPLSTPTTLHSSPPISLSTQSTPHSSPPIPLSSPPTLHSSPPIRTVLQPLLTPRLTISLSTPATPHSSPPHFALYSNHSALLATRSAFYSNHFALRSALPSPIPRNYSSLSSYHSALSLHASPLLASRHSRLRQVLMMSIGCVMVVAMAPAALLAVK